MRALIIPSLLVSLSLFATVRNVPATYATVQAALSACATGDTVLVQPGTYTTNVVWPNVNGIKLFSAGDSSNTILTANNAGRVIYINFTTIDTSTVIRGFTITGGNLTGSSGYGAGINISSASAKLEALCIRDNRVYVPGGWGYGGALHFSNSGSVMINSTVRNNRIDSATWCYGAGIYSTGGSVQLRDVNVHANLGKAEIWCYGVGIYATMGSLRATRVKVTANTSGNNPSYFYGTGMYLDDGQFSLTNVLVADNVSGTGGNFNYGGGIYCDGTAGMVNMMNVTVANNRKTGNTNINGTGLYVRDANVTATNCIFYNPNTGTDVVKNTAAVVTITYSDVRGGYTGTGNINILPGFISSSDYHLQTNSPCAGVGTNAGAPVSDLDNQPRPQPLASNTDMGCYEVSQLVGISENAAGELKLFPNPVTQETRVMAPVEMEIRIMDLSGKQVMVMQLREGLNTIDLSTLAPGMYFLVAGQQAIRFSKL